MMSIRRSAAAAAALERGLGALVWDGVFSQALGVLSGGTLLTGCALLLGASPSFVGVLAAVPLFAQLAHVPAVIVIEKLRRRRAICLVTTLVARLLLLPLAALPFIGDHRLALALMLVAFAALAPLAAAGGCAWMSWTCDLVPRARLGAVFGGRQLRATLSGIVAGALGAAIVSLWDRGVPGWRSGAYTLVFGLAFAAAMASTWCLTRMPEVAMPPPRHGRLDALFATPFRDGNFRRMMVFLGAWQFVTNLALPFFPVYLVRIGYGITTAIVLGLMSQLAGIAAVRFWARLSDRWSNKTVIALAAPLFLLCLAGWALSSALEGPPALALLGALQLLLGAAGAGLDLASGNIALKLAPRGEATVFLAANGLAKSLCAGCAPLLGGVLIDRLAFLDLPMIGHAPAWAIFFAAAAALGVVALSRLRAVEETGDTRLGLVLRSLSGRAARPLLPAEPAAALAPLAGDD
jgi:MFS family permease